MSLNLKLDNMNSPQTHTDTMNSLDNDLFEQKTTNMRVLTSQDGSSDNRVFNKLRPIFRTTMNSVANSPLSGSKIKLQVDQTMPSID